MPSLAIKVKLFQSYIKIRYPIIGLFVIVFIFTLPYFIPYDRDWTPQRSIYNENDYGHSELRGILDQNYDIKSEYLDITNLTPSKESTLIIISPQIDFKDNEIEFINNWVNRGGSLILIGTSEIFNQIASNWGYYINFANGPIYDFVNNKEEKPGFPIIDSSITNKEFVSVIPKEIVSNSFNIDENNRLNLETKPSAENQMCIEYPQNSCGSPYIVGIADENTRFSLIADDWLLSNVYVKKFPTNLELIPLIVNYINSETSTIIFDESHYRWAPLNKKGVEVLEKNLIESSYYGPIILILAILIPLIIAFAAGMFTDTVSSFKSKLTKRIGERLNRLHLENVPAVPLTLEERFLVEEQLELRHRKNFYFQYVANYLTDYIDEEQIIEYFPQILIENLQTMQRVVIPKAQAWNLVKKVNSTIEDAKKIRDKSRIDGDITFQENII